MTDRIVRWFTFPTAGGAIAVGADPLWPYLLAGAMLPVAPLMLWYAAVMVERAERSGPRTKGPHDVVWTVVSLVGALAAVLAFAYFLGGLGFAVFMAVVFALAATLGVLGRRWLS